MDGFFVAKLQKFSNANPDGVEETETVEEPEEEIEVPKNAKKNDWFYKDALDKKKDHKKDSKYEETVLEKFRIKLEDRRAILSQQNEGSLLPFS
jgi:ribosomal RNA methyltransferase Nop2